MSDKLSKRVRNSRSDRNQCAKKQKFYLTRKKHKSKSSKSREICLSPVGVLTVGLTFSGAEILIMARKSCGREFANLSSKREEVITNIIVKNGGIVSYKFSLRTTHIICSEATSIKEMCSCLGVDDVDVPSITIITPDWVAACLRAGSVDSGGAYMWHGARISRESPTNTCEDRKEPSSSSTDGLSSSKTEESKESLSSPPPLETPEPSTSSNSGHPSRGLACQIRNSGLNGSGLNGNIVSTFEELQSIYASKNDKFRAMTYKHAANHIRQIDHVITLADLSELAGIPRIGGKVVAKVREILETGTVKLLEEFRGNEETQVVKMFENVWGAGPKVAAQWYRQGFRTLKDLQERAKLDRRQKVGVRLYDDILQRMSRTEAAAIETCVREGVLVISARACVRVCGSFRRGKPTCGDVDILVTHPDRSQLEGLCLRVVEALDKTGFLTDHLSMPSKNNTWSDDDDHDTYMGVCLLPGHSTHRRIDIKVYSPTAFPFAMLYFTGSDHFVRSMRFYAKKLGFQLTDVHLARVTRTGTETVIDGRIACETEEDIFRALGLNYVKPTERNCYESFSKIAS
eukprot:895511_1